MDFRWLAYVRKNFTGKFSTREKCQQAWTNTRTDEMMAVKLQSSAEAQMI